jgi:hypothetical protein
MFRNILSPFANLILIKFYAGPEFFVETNGEEGKHVGVHLLFLRLLTEESVVLLFLAILIVVINTLAAVTTT